MMSYWPRKSHKSPELSIPLDDMIEYDNCVVSLFIFGTYPSVDGLRNGALIKGCWTARYSYVKAVMQCQNSYSVR